MILAILQARFSSSRLPGKVLKPLLGQPMLGRQIERLGRCKGFDKLTVATSTDRSDDAIEQFCRQTGLACFRGSLNDVLDRFYQAALPYAPEHVVRLTGDCPLIDPELVDRIVEFHLARGDDYTSNTIDPTFPDGLDVEVFRFEALRLAWQEAVLPSAREHVTIHLYTHPDTFRLGIYRSATDLSNLRWTVDEVDDFAMVETVYSALYPVNPCFSTGDILAFLAKTPELLACNSSHARNEGLLKSSKEDEMYLQEEKRSKVSERYRKSEEMLTRALSVMPLGTQTFSKSRTQYPLGVSPFFVEKAKGCRCWDVDGNEYLDFINGLCAVTLGYNDPEVTEAVKTQLENGVIFSLPHPLEVEVAEKIVEMVPCAELVRFGKNGSDATAGAIRIARAFTHRDHVAACGYHGWQDWYIGATTRNLGVPDSTTKMTHLFSYNDPDSLLNIFQEHPDGVAAVIMEPMNVFEPKDDFLQVVQEIARKHGAVLIFDETITGFRYANGGAQELFGVTPDLATFGKGLANGYPLSAVAGRADIMQLMEEVFFSFTFGGETLSLAASLATMNKLQREPVVETLVSSGKRIIAGLRDLIVRHEAQDFLSVAGHPTWSFLMIQDTPEYPQYVIKTLFLQEMFARNILMLSTHNLSFAHAQADIDRLLVAYDEVLPILADAVRNHKVKELLRCEPLKPLFKVR